MYLFNGIIVWAITLALLIYVIRGGYRYLPDPREAKLFFDELIDEIVDHPVKASLIIGLVSVIFIVIWPITLFVLSLVLFIGIVGYVPYQILVRSRTKKESKKQTNNTENW